MTVFLLLIPMVRLDKQVNKNFFKLPYFFTLKVNSSPYVLGDYQDARDLYDVTYIDFTRDVDNLCKWVRGVKATCGYDGDECYELVLRQVNNYMYVNFLPTGKGNIPDHTH